MEDFELVTTAYASLLQLPANGLRLRLQSVLATLRDEIADYTGDGPEYIQTMFEEEARRKLDGHESENELASTPGGIR